ncbi:MAG: YfhO family protein [Bacteroidales bacterium]|nr:YfhO family protein [Bacteroidales bacterium]
MKRILTYIGIIALFVAVAYLFTPWVMGGKIVRQSDIISWQGMAHEILEHNEAHPDDPTLWTNSMFGGMPATQISVKYKGDWTEWIYNALFWGVRPPSYLIISLIGAWLMFLAFGVNPWLSAVGAIAVSFCSYNMQILQVGHNTKMVAIAFMPWVLASLIYAYRRNPLLGAAFFGLTLSFQIKANHPQISYYLAIMVLVYAVCQCVHDIRTGRFKKFLAISFALLFFGLCGIATNANKLLPTYEYAAHTMRGGSELSQDGDNATGGLDLDYATAWSYGIGETPNLWIPNFNGGASSGALSTSSETYKALRPYQGASSLIKQMPLYWGPQPFTAGPMYMGALSVLLFVFGMCVIKKCYRWWLAVVAVLALLLGWGSHAMWFSELFFRYVPMYNKFRTVSMILVLLQLVIPLAGILGVQEVLREDFDRKKAIRSLLISFGVVGGLTAIFALIPSLAGSFISSADSQVFGNNSDLTEAIRADRRTLLRMDALRSLGFMACGVGVLWLTLAGKIRKQWICWLSLGVLIMADLWMVDRRYLNESHFYTKQNAERQFDARLVDRVIHEDTDPDFRVLDLSVNTFNDAITSYHHKTIGGYSPAKLQRYQDLIEHCISPEMNRMTGDINSAISTAETFSDIEKALKKYPVLAMLNTKYVIIDGGSAPLHFPGPGGNAWFVNKVVEASDADQEMALLQQIDPLKEAVINTETFGKVSAGNAGPEAEIKLVKYAPNALEYEYTAGGDALAVFSEIYYPDGWQASIDGQSAGIIRANYVLRAMKLPAGSHKIEMRFNPPSFRTGRIISTASSAFLVVMLLGIGGLYILTRVRGRKEDRQ